MQAETIRKRWIAEARAVVVEIKRQGDIEELINGDINCPRHLISKALPCLLWLSRKVGGTGRNTTTNLDRLLLPEAHDLLYVHILGLQAWRDRQHSYG